MGQIKLNGKNYSNAFPKKEENILPVGYTRLIDHAPIARNGDYVTITMPEYYSDYDYIYLVCIEDNYQQDYIDDLFNTHIKYEEDIDTPLIDRVYKMRTDSITHGGISVQVPYLDNEFNYNSNTFTLTITDETITATSNTGTLTDTNLIVIGVHHYDYWLPAFETQSSIDTGIKINTQEALKKDWEVDFETESIPVNSSAIILTASGGWLALSMRIYTGAATGNILAYVEWSGYIDFRVPYSEIGNSPTTWKIKKSGRTIFVYINGNKVYTGNISQVSNYNNTTITIGSGLSSAASFGYFGFRWMS